MPGDGRLSGVVLRPRRPLWSRGGRRHPFFQVIRSPPRRFAGSELAASAAVTLRVSRAGRLFDLQRSLTRFPTAPDSRAAIRSLPLPVAPAPAGLSRALHGSSQRSPREVN